MLGAAIAIITLALVFYSIGVWAERIQGILKPWHATMFAFGLACDSTGTFLMTKIAGENAASGQSAGGLGTLMAVTGSLALALMAIHLIWAIIVLNRNKQQEKVTFHKFSIIVWAIWLIPYVAGAVVAMAGAK